MWEQQQEVLGRGQYVTTDMSTANSIRSGVGCWRLGLLIGHERGPPTVRPISGRIPRAFFQANTTSDSSRPSLDPWSRLYPVEVTPCLAFIRTHVMRLVTRLDPQRLQPSQAHLRWLRRDTTLSTTKTRLE